MKPLVDLAGKRGLVVGIANEHSIAAGCAEAFAQCGARLAATYLNAKAEQYVAPVAAEQSTLNGWMNGLNLTGL